MTTSKKLLLASIPSAGSDWLAQCFTDAVPELVTPAMASDRYKDVKEFFNPICNHVSPLVSQYFGCELPSTVRNLTRRLAWNERCDLMEFWPQEATFTKETFAVYQVGSLSASFDVVKLIRSAEHTFPPKRLRVWAWYQAIGQGLGMKSFNPRLWQAEAIAAHAVYSTMLDDFGSSRPSLRWEKLVTASPASLLAMLRDALPDWMQDHALSIADRILTTRNGCGRSL